MNKNVLLITTTSTPPLASVTMTARERIISRRNLRVSAQLPPTRAAVYGLAISALAETYPPLVEPGDCVMVYATPGGVWSSNGDDHEPATGPWLVIHRTQTTTSYPAPSVEDSFVAGTVDVTTVSWEIQYWLDGVKDAVSWTSEARLLENAADIFEFRTWLANDGNEPKPIWMHPMDPEWPTPEAITDAAMLALGYTHQTRCTIGGVTWHLPLSSSPWA